jgi:hypothetical protein
MSARIAWDVSSEDITDPSEAEALILETLNMVTVHGTRGITIWLGPTGADRDDMVLRLDLDPEPGREPIDTIEEIETLPEITTETLGAASVRWLPDNLIAVDPAIVGVAIKVMEDSSEDLVDITASEVRLTIPEAIALAREYVSTNQRPTQVPAKEQTIDLTWSSLPPIQVSSSHQTTRTGESSSAEAEPER